MGATVSTDYAVGVIKGYSEPLYVMWEQTYDKRTHPHTPRWDMVSMETKAGFIQKVFNMASSCEGGMLQGRSGEITPEAYIQRWMNAAKNPLDTGDLTLTLKRGTGFGDTFTTKQVENPAWYETTREMDDENLKWMRDSGYAKYVDRIESGESVVMSASENAKLILGLIARGKSLWKMTGGGLSQPVGIPNPTLAMDHAPIKGVFSGSKVGVFIQIEDSYWHWSGDKLVFAGYQYDLIGRMIRNDLLADEMRQPGSFKKNIKVYRDSIKNSPKGEQLGLDMVLDMDVHSNYHFGLRIRLFDALGQKTRVPIKLALDMLHKAGEYGSINAGEKFIYFVLSDPSSTKCKPEDTEVQQLLFAD